MNCLTDCIAPPTKASILSNLSLANDVITNGSSVNLSCLAVSRSGLADITYHWYFRGVAVTPTQPGLFVDVNVLMVSGGLNGSVQCFAINRAGSTSATVILCE